MKEITRAVTTADLAEFLGEATRATVAWSDGGDVVAEPAAFRYEGGRYLVGLPAGRLSAGVEVAALIDGGPMYFDLRGVRLRGPAVPVSGEGGLDWFEVRPEREVAWHYGTLRQR